jgi:hypothetical protein
VLHRSDDDLDIPVIAVHIRLFQIPCGPGSTVDVDFEERL